MGYIYPAIAPGIDVEKTPTLNAAGWSACSGIRFFQGMAQKGGGWNTLADPIVGWCRGMNSWADLNGNPYLGLGTSQRLQVFSGGVVYDITPIYQTDNPAPSFSTNTATPSTVTIGDVNTVQVGDWVNVVVPVSVGGVVVQGFYQVTATGNPFAVSIAPQVATSTVVNGGAVPLYTPTSGSPNLKVTLNNHGLVLNNLWTVHVATLVGGFNLAAGTTYAVTNVIDANNFDIQPGGNATGNTAVSENGGNAQIQYLIHSGLQSAVAASGQGYGGGPYGGGPYGMSGASITPLRQWFLSNFGQLLIGNYSGSPSSPLYVWTPPISYGNVALALNTTNFPSATTPPTQVNFSFLSAPQQMIVCLGTTDTTNTYNPLLVRWCDAGNFQAWTPQPTNLAGSYPLSSGSKLVGGVSTSNFNVLWTDVDMWLMSYLGSSGYVWGFTKVVNGPPLLSARSACVLGAEVFFAAPNGFYRYNGISLRPIKCTVWDKFWFNLDFFQADKVNAQPNSYFREVSWAFPSASGNGECDQRVTVNIDTGDWWYEQNTQWIRTAWVDDNVYGAPAGVDLNWDLQQHEVSNDAGGSPLTAFVQTGWMAVSEGSTETMVERIEADFIATGGTQRVYVTVFAQDFPNDPNVKTYGPFAFIPTGTTLWSIVRARGRFIAIEFSSTDLGVFWRLGRHRYFAKAAGRR